MMWGYGFGWMNWLMMLSMWVLFVVGVVSLVRMLRTPAEGGGVPSARRILDERFASGDLSAEDYDERRRVLR